MTPRRGDVWLVHFGDPIGREQAGQRPALVVSADQMNESRAGVVIVVPCTTSRRDLPSHVELDPADSGLDDLSYVKCEDVKSVSTERLIARLGSAPLDALVDVAAVLRYLLVL